MFRKRVVKGSAARAIVALALATKSRSFELAALVFAVLLFALVEYFGYRSAETSAASAASVRHTHEVIETLDALLLAEVDAETARRGYALTGREEMLAPSHDAAARVKQSLTALRRLVADNPEELKRLDALEPDALARIRMLDEAIAARRARGGLGTAEIGLQDTIHAATVMTRVRAGIAAMTDAERSLLREREAATAKSLSTARAAQLLSGAVALVLVVVFVGRLRREVLSRDESEERTRENEQNLATTLQSIGDGVIVTDVDGKVVRINPVAERITGWKAAEALGQPIAEVFHLVVENTDRAASNPVERAMRDGRVIELDDAAMLVAKDGKRRRVADSAAPIRGTDDRVTGAVLVFRDITKVLEDARALRRAHAFLDSLVDNIPDMIFVKDAQELAFVRFNRAGEALLGAKREDMLGKTDFAFFPPDQAKAFVEKDRETLRGKVILDIPEEPITTAKGVRWLHTKKVPIVDEDGEPEYLLGISEDITERRRGEVQLRASKDATEVAHRELEAFSYSVAHDLRAPLRSIDGFSQALLDDYSDKLDDEGKSHLARVRNAARRMAELIDDLLALARVSRSDLSRTTVDITTIAREVGEQAKRDHNAKAELLVADGLVADADARLVRVLFENILSNAFKFSGRREDARIEVGASGTPAAFFVRDNGAGFDMAAAKKLFTAFQRYHRPTEYEGTGIGLATAERIVSRHGGRIWAESAPGEGATFHFTFEPGAKP